MYFQFRLSFDEGSSQHNVPCIKVDQDNVDAAAQASESKKRSGPPSSAEELEESSSKIPKTHDQSSVATDGKDGSTPPPAPDSVKPTESQTPARFLVGGMTHRQAWVLILLPWVSFRCNQHGTSS